MSWVVAAVGQVTHPLTFIGNPHLLAPQHLAHYPPVLCACVCVCVCVCWVVVVVGGGWAGKDGCDYKTGKGCPCHHLNGGPCLFNVVEDVAEVRF